MNKENTTNNTAGANELQGNIGTFELVMSVLALSAPLMTVAGICPQMLNYGSNSGPITYLIVTLILFLFSVGFVKMGMYMKNPGGFYAYITAGLGKHVGLGSAFLASVGYPLIGFIGSCYFPLVFCSYIRDYLNGPDIPWWIVSLLYLAAIAYIDCRGVSLSVKLMSFIMLLEVIIVVILDIGCFLHDPGAAAGGSSLSMPEFFNKEYHVGLSMLFIYGTFLGFESTVIYREEVKDPDKTIPRATMIAVISIGIFYAIAVWAFISCYGANDCQAVAANDLDGLLQSTFLMLFGKIFVDIVTILIMTSMMASSISVVNASSRYLYSLGKDGVLPKAIGKAHSKYHSPYVGILIVCIVYAIVVVCMAIVGADPVYIFPRVNGIGTFTVMLVMLIASVAIPVWFWKNPISEVGKWTSLIAPILGIAGIAFCSYQGLINYSELTGGGSVLTAVGLILTVLIFVGGFAYSYWLEKNKPDTYNRIGRQQF